MSLTIENTATTVSKDLPKLSMEEIFENELARWGTSAWLQIFKREKWNQYLEMPLPARKDQHFRFANLAELDCNETSLAESVDETKHEVIASTSQVISDVSGRLVFLDDELVTHDPVSDALKQQGVVWLPFAQAILDYPDLIEPHLRAKKTELGSEKLEALHHALFKNGSFLYVPKNVEIEKPFTSYYWASNNVANLYPHTLIVTEANAKASLVQVFESTKSDKTPEASSLVNSVTSIFAGEGSSVRHSSIQNFSENTAVLRINSSEAQTNASIKTFVVNSGSRYSRFENQMCLMGEGADIQAYSLGVSMGEKELDQRTLQKHAASHTTSNLLYKNVLLENSKSIFSGLIKVEDAAPQTDAYQTNRNLLLSPTAEACSLPGLEIENNDVKCSHGATTTQLDPDELFYMKTRGIPEAVAYELLVFGFFEEIIDKLENEDLEAFVHEILRENFQTQIRKTISN